MRNDNGRVYKAREIIGGLKNIAFPNDAVFEYYRRYVDADGTVRYVPVKEG